MGHSAGMGHGSHGWQAIGTAGAVVAMAETGAVVEATATATVPASTSVMLTMTTTTTRNAIIGITAAFAAIKPTTAVGPNRIRRGANLVFTLPPPFLSTSSKTSGTTKAPLRQGIARSTAFYAFYRRQTHFLLSGFDYLGAHMSERRDHFSFCASQLGWQQTVSGHLPKKEIARPAIANSALPRR